MVKASVIIPVLNTKVNWFDLSVQSVLKQSGDFEIIISDDGSTSLATISVLNKYTNHPRILVIRNERIGIGMACHRAIEQASGELIIRHDSDDYMLPNRIIEQTTYMDEHPDVDITSGHLVFIDEHGMILDVMPLHNESPEPYWQKDWSKNGICNPTVCFRKEKYFQVGGYNSIKVEDLDLWCRWYKVGMKHVFLPRYYTAYRQHKQMTTAHHNFQRTVKIVREYYQRNTYRIAVLTPTIDYGGWDDWLIDFIKGVNGDFIVLGLKDQGCFNQEAISNLLIYTGVDLIDSSQVKDRLEKYQPDMIFTWSGIRRLDEMLADWKKPVIWYSVAAITEQWQKDRVEQAKKSITHYTANSRISCIIPQSCGIPLEQITVIHKAIDKNRLITLTTKAEARKKYNIPENKFVIGYVGRFSWEKRVHLLVEAAKMLPDDCHVVLAGDGWEGAKLRALADHHVTFLPYSYDVADYYVMLDCLWCGSTAEGFCGMIAEAGILGIPVISTTVGILIEIKEKSGLLWQELADEFTPTDVVLAVQKVRQDTTDMTQKLQSILSEFKTEKMTQEWESFLTKIFENSK